MNRCRFDFEIIEFHKTPYTGKISIIQITHQKNITLSKRLLIVIDKRRTMCIYQEIRHTTGYKLRNIYQLPVGIKDEHI